MTCFGGLKSDSGNTTFSRRPERITAFVVSLTRSSFVKYLSGRKLFAGNVVGWTEKRIYCLIRFCVVTSALETVLNLREFVSVFWLYLYFLTYNQIFYKQIGMLFYFQNNRGSTVVKVLCYESEGRWFDPRWCHWNFSFTLNPSDRTIALGSTQPLTELSTRSISWG